MHSTQNYMLTIQDLFVAKNGVICGAEAVVGIFDGNVEVDRLSFRGKVGPGGEGYSRGYTGQPGLESKLLTEVGRIAWEATRP